MPSFLALLGTVRVGAESVTDIPTVWPQLGDMFPAWAGLLLMFAGGLWKIFVTGKKNRKLSDQIKESLESNKLYQEQINFLSKMNVLHTHFLEIIDKVITDNHFVLEDYLKNII